MRKLERHGCTRTKLYWVWASMIQRCHKQCRSYRFYGARGIKVCAQWRGSFIAFRDWAIPAGYAPGLFIDRIDGRKNYKPANCRWVTLPVSNANRRPNSTNVYLTIGDRRMTPQEWARDERCPVDPWTIRHRLKKGWTPEQAVFTPAYMAPC